MIGFGTLLRQRLRRDRIQLLFWILGTGLLGLFAAAAVGGTYGDEAERAGLMALVLASPGILMFRGLPQGLSLDAFAFFQIFIYLALLAGLMSTFLAVRHTRAEEESGRAELVGATPAGRLAPTLATLVHGAIANAILALVVALALIAGGLEAGGSVLAGAAAGATGVAFVGVGALAAQVVRSSRAANGLSVAVVMAAFLLRGLGAVLGTPDPASGTMVAAWPTWVSPIGWGEETSPFGSPSALPLLLDAGLFLVCSAVVIVLLGVRDSGASILSDRAGRAAAPPWLTGALGLGWRLQWGTVVAWGVGGALCGLFAGTLNGLVTAATQSDPSLGDTLSTLSSSAEASASQALVAAMFSMAGALAAACATQAIIRVRQEEALGTAEQLLVSGVGRQRMLAVYLVVGAIAIVVVMAAAALVAVIGASATGQQGVPGSDVVATAAAGLPAAFVYLGVVALVFVLVPRATIPAGWSLLAVGIFLGIFGGIVGIPEWIRDLSPFSHTPVVGTGDTDWSGAAWMSVVAVVAVAVALVLVRRRELRTG